MSILLVRHGEAVSATAGDRDRYLTLRGRSETAAVGRHLAALSLTPGTIVSSPLVRAVQTAEILAHALSFAGVVTTDTLLVPEADPATFVRRIAPTGETLVVVCHEPIIRGIAALLVREPTFPAFRTSGAVLIEAARATLRVEP